MRRGFTLLELIVVILIIAVLAALLFPAISRVKEASRTLSCANRLKQIGLAAHNYRDTHAEFPPGTVLHPTLSPDERLSWQVTLLPDLEQPKGSEKFDRGEAWNAPANVGAEKACQVPVLMCSGLRGTYPSFAHTNYIGVAGIGPDAASLARDGPGIGFFGYDRKLKLDDVKDGTSNTLMVLETAANLGPWVRGGPSTVRGLNLSDEPLLGEGRAFGGLHRAEKTFGGTRPLGAQMLLADGSVKLSPVHVEAHILGALATVAGREEVSLDW